jgi:leucyl-tRNA synthetase
MYDIRVVTKILRDAGILEFLEDGEPFAGVLMHEMVHMEGRKMSKHIGNVVSPESLVERHGADTLRMAVLFAAAPDRSIDWTEAPLELCGRFLSRLWEYCGQRRESWPEVSLGPWDKETPIQRRLFVERCEAAYGKIIRQYHLKQLHRVTRSAMEHFDLIQEFDGESTSSSESAVCAWAMGRLLHLLMPIAPHIAEELWRRMGGSEMLVEAHWWEKGAP